MSLYIRVNCNFFTHRKTAKLKSLIGESALWVPPRLWAYAAENQPDGDFSEYSADEIAMLISYPSDATSMLQALLQARFMDSDMKLHNWLVHNGYHKIYAERAKVAAAARWKKASPTPPERTEEELRREERRGDKHCLEHATSIPAPELAPPGLAHIPTETEFVAMFMTVGIPEDYLRHQWGKLDGNNDWLDKHGRLKNLRSLIAAYWLKDKPEWERRRLAKNGHAATDPAAHRAAKAAREYPEEPCKIKML